MKPKLFIGSSTEALGIAHKIQEILEEVAVVTVWTENVSNLSSNILDDLIKASDEFNFGIFVFNPDDVLEIRKNKHSAVRDNVIFELGLFIGKLGKERVFFLIPNDNETLRLPTDLLGVNAGVYDSKRDDGDLKVALGPFCNQIKERIKSFYYEGLIGFEEESKQSRKLAAEKPDYWEFNLASELLKTRMDKINKELYEIDNGLGFRNTKRYNGTELTDFIGNSMSDIVRVISIFKNVYQIELVKSFGEPGEPGNVYEIKYCCDKVYNLCKELLNWEYNFISAQFPEAFVEIGELMKGWAKDLIIEINRFPKLLDEAFSAENIASGKEIKIELVFEAPKNSDRVQYLLSRLDASELM
jgi:hypothetical protein